MTNAPSETGEAFGLRLSFLALFLRCIPNLPSALLQFAISYPRSNSIRDNSCNSCLAASVPRHPTLTTTLPAPKARSTLHSPFCILHSPLQGSAPLKKSEPSRNGLLRACLKNPLPLPLWRRGPGRGGRFLTHALHFLAICRYALKPAAACSGPIPVVSVSCVTLFLLKYSIYHHYPST